MILLQQKDENLQKRFTEYVKLGVKVLEVPDHLECPISEELMEDPVVI